MNYKKIIIFVISLGLIAIIFVVFSSNNETTTDSKIKIEKKENKKVYKYTFPERISKNDYFKGEFISNDIASVYPRRGAIIRDILVDIGDKVKSGETLAILFNPGVEGEGQSKINFKNIVVSSKNNFLEEVNNVKIAKIIELDQKIIGKEIILKETINNFDLKISQIGDNETLGSEYQVQLKGLENLQKNLSNSIISKDELLKESKNNIIQKEKLLSSKIDEIYNKIIPILYIGNADRLDYREINSYDFSDYFGAKDSSSKNIFITKIKKFHNNYDYLDVVDKYNSLLDINESLILVLQNTITSVDLTESDISTNISNINIYNTSLILQKEVFDDAENGYRILDVTQTEKNENLEIQILKKENEIALLSTKSSLTESEKSLSVEKLKAEIETLKKSRDLLIANENKTITALENEIAIVKADLNSEYIKSGDYKITSPFSGIISKRGIEMGEKISQNTEAFRLVGVNNTLSRITKKEIKFYVPENLKDNLEINKEIKFYFGNKNEKSFTGTIYRIAPEIDEKTLSITVQAKVSEKVNLPNKSTVRVSLETKEDIFRVPSSSIYNKGERKIMYYKKNNGKLGVRNINIISEDGEFSLVSGEFDENLRIVITPIFIK